MSKVKDCPLCGSDVKKIVDRYESEKKDVRTGEKIVVENVATYACRNSECKHKWLPLNEEKKIDDVIASRMRFDLSTEDIALIRQALGCSTKYEVAKFLELNEKAFTKWEREYSSPNRAYDLLLRLSVFSKENVEFIKYLHEKNFKFDKNDYQLICEEERNEQWIFNRLKKRPMKLKEINFAPSSQESENESYSNDLAKWGFVA